MANIIPPGRNESIVDRLFFGTQRMVDWMQAISRLSVLEGNGSPEGVITAQRTRWYYDIANDDIYFKTTSGGNTGWRIV